MADTRKTPPQLSVASDVQDTDILVSWRGSGPLKQLQVGTLQANKADIDGDNIVDPVAFRTALSFTGDSHVLGWGSVFLPGWDGASDKQLQVSSVQPTYLPNGTTGPIYGQRLATYTGGSSMDSNSQVNAALRAYNQVATTVTYAVECGVLGVVDSYSYRTQPVGTFGQANSRHGGRAWGKIGEAHEYPETFTATASQTVFAIPNGYTPAKAIVSKNGTLLTRTTDYVDSSGTNIVLTSGATVGDIIVVHRGDPVYATIGDETDIFVSDGTDRANATTGNRVGTGVYLYRQDTTLNVATEVGTGHMVVSDPTDSYLTTLVGYRTIGRFATGFDTSGGTISGSAYRLGSGQSLSFTTTDDRTWDYTGGLLNYRVGGSARFQLDDSGFVYIQGPRVLVSRRTGWGAPTGTATRTAFDTSTVTLPQLAERLKALIDDLTTHGLIGA